MKFLFSIFFTLMSIWLLANGNPSGKSVIVKGVVNESLLGESLSGVRVSVVGSESFTYSDKNGFFEIETTADTKTSIQFSLVSFESKVIDVDPASSVDILQISMNEK